VKCREFAYLPPTRRPKSDSKHTKPMQNTIHKRFRVRRDHVKISRLESAVSGMTLGVKK
jgi:hypothetical protein